MVGLYVGYMLHLANSAESAAVMGMPV